MAEQGLTTIDKQSARAGCVAGLLYRGETGKEQKHLVGRVPETRIGGEGFYQY